MTKQHLLTAFTPNNGTSCPPYFNATVTDGVVEVSVRDSKGVQARMFMTLHDWVTCIEQSRAKVLMQGDPEAYVNEKLRAMPLTPPQTTEAVPS